MNSRERDPSEAITTEAESNDTQERGLVTSTTQLIKPADEKEMASEIIILKNIPAEKAVDVVTRVIPNIIAVRSGDSDTIVIRGDEAVVKEALKMISSIDKKSPQILIEGKIVEVSESGLSDIGIIWGKEQGSFKFAVDRSSGVISQSNDIIGTINALIASGKAKLLANPKISALNGKEAEINIGSRIPYAVPAGSGSTATQWTVQYIDAGVNLKINPTISDDGTIVSTIKPEVSNVSEWRMTQAGEFPVISTRNASVTVRLKDGQTLVIGGLINELERENVSGIPIASDIPVIGGFFQRRIKEKTKTDVVFLITPHIMD